MKLVKYLSINSQVYTQIRKAQCCTPCRKPQHLICFKQWTADMVMDIICSAINMKRRFMDTHQKRLNILNNVKVTILQEVNEPALNLAVSKAATFMGAYDVNVTDHLLWDQDFNGSIFSTMSDIIFVSTSTHMCVQRFAEKSRVPVLCMRSRTHASIQSLSTIMAIIEEYGTIQGHNISYVGTPHPVLNSYLLLCPMLGANIRYKCCCQKCPISPLLMKASEDMTSKSATKSTQCSSKEDTLANSSVVIAGPTTSKKDKIPEFKISVLDIKRNSRCSWIFFHTLPRGEEVDDKLFNHCNARTLLAFENMQYIAAALMAYSVKGFRF